MSKGALVVLSLPVLASCATSETAHESALSPDEVMAAADSYDGRVIKVRGWLGGCLPGDYRMCGVYSNQRNAVGPEPLEWPLRVEFPEKQISKEVRPVIATGTFVLCRNTDRSVCSHAATYLSILTIED